MAEKTKKPEGQVRRYRVVIQESWQATYYVEAQSEDDARDQIIEGIVEPDCREFLESTDWAIHERKQED